MKYKVEIIEVLSRVVEVEANNEEEAINEVEEQYYNEVHVLSADDYKETSYKVV